MSNFFMFSKKTHLLINLKVKKFKSHDKHSTRDLRLHVYTDYTCFQMTLASFQFFFFIFFILKKKQISSHLQLQESQDY
jgi:hypothetical protein